MLDTGPLVRSFMFAAFIGVGCGRLGFDPTTSEQGDATISTDLVVTSSTMEGFDVARAAGSPTTPVAISVRVSANVTVSASSPATPAFTTGALPPGSSVTLVVDGSIIGAGGGGGSGGNGGTGGDPRRCGRDGGAGGTAILLTVPTTITINGLVAGGGGGGGGVSGCNENGGGGGGAGTPVGAGGAEASSLTMTQELAFCGQDNAIRMGVRGMNGSALAGGQGVMLGSGGLIATSGNGGALGKPGANSEGCVGGVDGAGGGAGYAIKRGTAMTNIADGSYATGSGPIRGPIGP